MGHFRDFVEGLWLADKNAEIGKSKIYPPPPVKKQTKTPKTPAREKFRIPPPPKVNLTDK